MLCAPLIEIVHGVKTVLNSGQWDCSQRCKFHLILTRDALVRLQIVHLVSVMAEWIRQEHTTGEIQEHRLASWYSVYVCFNINEIEKSSVWHLFICYSFFSASQLLLLNFSGNFASQPKDIDCLSQPAVYYNPARNPTSQLE